MQSPAVKILGRPAEMDGLPGLAPRPSRAWLWQTATGMALVVLLGLHLIANHFVVSKGIRDFDDVISYLRNPVILLLETLFLAVVATHAMLGVRAILLDLGLSRQKQRMANRALTLIGIGTVCYALWLTWVVIR